MRGLYIHIPFCASKCAYCDFCSYTHFNDIADSFFPKYINALIKESDLYPDVKTIQTLYIGGGTPSLLTEQQLELLSAGIAKRFGPIAALKESTFEANPESLTEGKLKILKDFGFSRLSLGMQSTSDKHLKIIGRAHNRQQFFDAYALAGKYFDNINVDIITNLPKQSLRDFKTVLEETIALKPQHLSVYGLQIEEGTKLFEQGYKGSESLSRKMLELAYDYLTGIGYEQYEISNYSLPNRQSLHNINYWDSGEYLGLGSAAASYLNGIRRQNTEDVEAYIAKVSACAKPTVFEERLQDKALKGEKILLALRKSEGIPLTREIYIDFADSIDQLVSKELLRIENNFLKLTNEGKYLANTVFRHFVEPF